jgi:glycosyltransferase involved in cell wall biosynthesis
MKIFIKKLAPSLPFIGNKLKYWIELEQKTKLGELEAERIELETKRMELETNLLRFKGFFEPFQNSKNFTPNIDHHPWDNPYLTHENISKFRTYSTDVWRFTLDYLDAHPEPLKCAFAVNMAQNAYKWAKLAQKYGASVGLFPNPMDTSAVNLPEWEEFNGEFPDLMDGDNFLKTYPDIQVQVPSFSVPMEGSELYSAFRDFCLGSRIPLLHLMSKSRTLRHEILLAYDGFYPYFATAKALADYDVIYAASNPLPAYASGKPYCAFSVGGDLQYDCGKSDDLGKLMSLSFNAARFLMISNPHAIGHCRRLGLTNGIYLPYPMDASIYSPGEGQARKTWETTYGEGVFVLATSRLDKKVKGQSDELFQALVDAAKIRPELRFVFLAWGNSLPDFQAKIADLGMGNQFILLPPVGKKRLIDYYRSCDIVLDQFVYGYYGATGLEAASIGKPILIKLREEQYAPLYAGDVAPMINVSQPHEVFAALLRLVDNPDLRVQIGKDVRAWLLRNHGEEKTMPLLLGLLRLAADQVPLPKDLINPLYRDFDP